MVEPGEVTKRTRGAEPLGILGGVILALLTSLLGCGGAAPHPGGRPPPARDCPAAASVASDPLRAAEAIELPDWPVCSWAGTLTLREANRLELCAERDKRCYAEVPTGDVRLTVGRGKDPDGLLEVRQGAFLLRGKIALSRVLFNLRGPRLMEDFAAADTVHLSPGGPWNLQETEVRVGKKQTWRAITPLLQCEQLALHHVGRNVGDEEILEARVFHFPSGPSPSLPSLTHFPFPGSPVAPPPSPSNSARSASAMRMRYPSWRSGWGSSGSWSR